MTKLIRDNWEDGNPATWGASPQYHVRNLLISPPFSICVSALLNIYVFEVFLNI